MDITKLYNISSEAIKSAAPANTKIADSGNFNSFLQAAVNQVNETNSYLQDQEDEEIKLALGLTDNTHDLAIAQAKAAAAVNYTTALRDKFLDAYREIMQMQV